MLLDLLAPILLLRVEAPLAKCSPVQGNCYRTRCCASARHDCFLKRGSHYARCRRAPPDKTSCTDTDEWLCPGWEVNATTGLLQSSIGASHGASLVVGSPMAGASHVPGPANELASSSARGRHGQAGLRWGRRAQLRPSPPASRRAGAPARRRAGARRPAGAVARGHRCRSGKCPRARLLAADVIQLSHTFGENGVTRECEFEDAHDGDDRWLVG